MHIHYYLSTYHKEYALYDHGINLLANHWTPSCRSRLNMFDVRSLLPVDFGACGAMLNASNMQHEIIGCGVLLGRPFDAGEIMGHSLRKFVYSNLTTQKQIRKIYGDDGIISAL